MRNMRKLTAPSVFSSLSQGECIMLQKVLALRLTGRERHIPIPTRYADLETHLKRDALRAQQRGVPPLEESR